MTFFIGIALFVAIYYLCGKASELVGINLGLLSIAHASVLGTAAYAYAMCARATGGPLTAALVAVTVASIGGAVLVGLSQRIRGSDYSLFTLALQLVWFAAVSGWDSLTGGALGIADVRPLVAGNGVTALATYLVAAGALGCTISSLWRFAQGRPFLRSCRIVVRSDELAASIGLPAVRMRLQIGLVYGLVLGAAGVLLANYTSVVDPTQFTISASMTIVAIGLFSGMRVPWLGPLAGAALLVGVPEGARLVAIGSERAGFLQMALAGTVGALFTYVLFRDRGLT